jgi:hypothetical protein
MSRPWALALYASFWALVLIQTAGPNPRSRLAAMAAYCEQLPQNQAMELGDYYRTWTLDWSLTPDGNFFSNKAPAPAHLGAPFYCAYARIVSDAGMSLADKRQAQFSRLYVFEVLISILLQLLPFVLGLGALLNEFRKRQRLDSVAVTFFYFAALLGTTATLFLNNYFGHGLSAALWVWALVCLMRRHDYWLGFFLALSLCTDYAAAFAIPGFFVAVALRDKAAPAQWLRSFVKIGVAALPLALYFFWYHHAAFGSILSLPQKFQNPEFVDVKGDSVALWGVLHLVPQPMVLIKLLVGFERGLLWTQPWVLAVLYGLVAHRRRFFERLKGYESVTIAVVLAFAGFLLFNSSFGGWHGGQSSGPRYLSPILPLFAFFVLPLWSALKVGERKILLCLLVYSVGVQCLALSTTICASPKGVLIFELLNELVKRPGTVLLRIAALSLAIMGWWFWQKRQKRVGCAGL